MDAPKPNHFVVEERDNGVEIRWRWFNAKRHVFMLFFCIAWDAFLVNWYSRAGSGPWIMSVFPIVHVAVGVGLTYSVLAGFLNRTRVMVADRSLSVQHGPVPWLGNRTLDGRDIEQLYCLQNQTQNKGSVTTRYLVRALMKDGSQVDLVKGLEEAQAAMFLEDQLERRLDIPAKSVPGELAR